MNNLSANIPPDLGATVELVVYTTQRRLRVNDAPDENARWQYFCPLMFGTERDVNGVLSPVCFYDDKDISSMVIQQGSGSATIVKPQGDPTSIDDDYIFSIEMQAGTNDNNNNFQGTLNDREGDWDWRGRFAGRQTQSRGGFREEAFGPDGRSTLQELLSYPSMSVQGTNAAQEEASRILGRLIQASIPNDVKQTLNLDTPQLDPEEEAIRQLAPDFLSRAAVSTLFKQWRNSEHVDSKQRDRIDADRCDVFYLACGASAIPKDEADPVAEFGWDRKRDANVIKKIQGQYRRVNLACYRLGYRRRVTRFQPFLAHPAYWYKRLAEYLDSPTHRERFTLRVLVRDPRVEPDIHDWYTQLALLKEAAGSDVEDAPEIEGVINALKGAALLSPINGVQINDAFIASLNELFDELETLDVDTEDYLRLKELLVIRETLTQGGFRRGVMQVLQHYQLSCCRVPTFGELYRSIRNTKCLGLPMNIVAPLLAGTAMANLIGSLATSEKPLSRSERIAMYLSLVPVGLSIVTTTFDWVKRLGAYITEALPSRIGKILSNVMVEIPTTVRSGLPKIGMTLNFALGVAIAVLCVWGAFDRFQQAWKSGETIDKWEAGCDLMFSILFSIVAAYTAGFALMFGASSVPSLCGVLTGGIAGSAFVLSLAFAAIKWYMHKDPIEPFVTKYGHMYGFLRK